MSGFNEFEDTRAVSSTPGVRRAAWVAVGLMAAIVVAVAIAMPTGGLPLLLGVPVLALAPTALGAASMRVISALESLRR